MPVSFEFIRGIIGVIGIGCAFMTGRSLALLRKRQQKQSKMFGWIFRTLLCMVAVALRNRLDIADIVIWTLALVAFSIALWENSRVKATEDLTAAIFPDSPDEP